MMLKNQLFKHKQIAVRKCAAPQLASLWSEQLRGGKSCMVAFKLHHYSLQYRSSIDDARGGSWFLVAPVLNSLISHLFQ